MLISESGRDTSCYCIMFEYLSESAQESALQFMNASSHYELNWDIMPMAPLPGGTINDYEQDDIDLQALVQIGYYR
jgi:hypothetical protein